MRFIPLTALMAAACLLLAASTAGGHFQVLLPDTDSLSGNQRPLTFDIRFTHPMAAGPVMAMDKPKQFGVLFHGQKENLLEALRSVNREGKPAYTSRYLPRVPADYVFYLEPAPYWEPAENKMIIHYTKVVVDGFGAEDGWDAAVGLPVEIEPLVRPYGLWAGNVFRGVVRRHGQPVPYATVEVEYYNEGRRLQAPSDSFYTQVLKADGQGVFCYAMPVAGWWGFAALVPGEEKIPNPAGRPSEVELGGLLWVRAHEPQLAR